MKNDKRTITAKAQPGNGKISEEADEKGVWGIKMGPKAFSSQVQNNIIHILSEKISLTAKEIYLRLQREFGISTSYQAAHKTLKQMISEQILLKKESKYSLNSEWVENFRKNAEQLSEKIKNPVENFNIQDLNENESKHFSFKGIIDTGWFLIDKFMSAPNPDKKINLALWRFCYSIVGLETKHYIRLKEVLSNNDWIAIVEENSPVGQMFGETLNSYGLKRIKFGIKCATKLSDKMIAGNYIVEIIYPSTFRKIWEIQYKLPRKLAEFSLSKHLMQMREMQPQIEVIVTKNEKMANEYRKEYPLRLVQGRKKVEPETLKALWK